MQRSSAYTIAVYLLLPLMWVNLTAGENRWAILGLGVGQLLYWIIIGLGWYVAFHSPYQKLATALLVAAFALRPMEAIGDGVIAHALRLGALAGVFTIAGAWIYGRDPHFLHRQLVVFLGLCVPLMLVQILGVSSFVLGWSTAYLDTNSGVMDESEVGTFMELPLYPTLFVAFDDLVYSSGQARPVGLMHASNILSIFVAFASVLTLVIPRSNRLRGGDVIVMTAVVLTMSKMVFGITAMVFVGALLFAPAERKVLTLKLLLILVVVGLLYYLLFPGLLEANLSEDMLRVSFLVRILGMLNALGVENVGTFLSEQQQLIGLAFAEGERYSAVALLLTTRGAVPALVAMGAVGLFYVYRLGKMGFHNSAGYAVLLLTLAATQFAVPFATAASFQLLLGLALFPLFRRLWRDRIPSEKPMRRTRGPAAPVLAAR